MVWGKIGNYGNAPVESTKNVTSGSCTSKLYLIATVRIEDR